jgi:sensor histidine kinase regulating citrate/malate metabolism
MNMIYQKIKSYKGDIEFDYEKGKFIEFMVSLPQTISRKNKKVA